MATVDGASEFRQPLSAVPAAIRWARATQARNLESLIAGQGPGGDALAPNRPYTIARKKGDRPGFGRTGEMSLGLVSADLTNQTGAATGDLEIDVDASTGPTDRKVNMFLRGHPPETINKTERTRSGVRTWTRTVPAVPGRDFIGIDAADVDAAGEALLDDIARQWGFR